MGTGGGRSETSWAHMRRYKGGDCLGASSALSSHIFPHILVHGFVSSSCMASARSATEEEIVMGSRLGVS
jgi:hypothetical protein